MTESKKSYKVVGWGAEFAFYKGLTLDELKPNEKEGTDGLEDLEADEYESLVRGIWIVHRRVSRRDNRLPVPVLCPAMHAPLLGLPHWSNESTLASQCYGVDRWKVRRYGLADATQALTAASLLLRA